MKGGSVTGSPPVCWRPSSVCVVVPLNGGVVGVCCPLVFGLGSPLHVVLSFLRCFFYPLPLSAVCVCCHSIVGLGLCLCGMAVMVCVGWKGAGGLLSTHHRVVVCVSVVCVMAVCVLSCLVALCCGLWNGGCVVSSLVFLFSLPSSSPLCVGVRGSARAALRARTLSPNTIASFLVVCFVLSSLLPAFLCASSFLLLWNGGG